MITIPGRAVPPLLRLVRANRFYVSAEGARRRLREATVRPSSYGPPRRLRRDVRVDVVQDAHWPIYTLRPLSTSTTRTTGSARPVGGVVYLHGGGWVNEIHPQHWALVAEIAADTGVAVTVPIYPLVPYGTAAPTQDRVVELVRNSTAAYGPTCLMGDSAGGQIALSAALKLRDVGVVLPRTLLISPALDLTWSNPRIPQVQPSDPWLGRDGGRVFAEAWRGDLPLTDPAVSPLFGDLSGLGPVTVFSGTRDIHNPDAHLLVQKARSSGVALDFQEQVGQLHVYPLLPTRRGREAREIIKKAIRAAVEPAP
jgi:acetyl esterase/lipase